MKRHILGLLVVTSLGLALLPGSAQSQQKSLKEQLAGTWTLVSNDLVGPDGAKRPSYGPNPKGVLILDAGGRYALIITRSDLPDFKANNRLKGTPQENQAIVRGTNANFGTWSVDEASKTLIIRYEAATFPNHVKTDLKRSVAVSGDELKVQNPTPSAGGSGESVWRRAK